MEQEITETEKYFNDFYTHFYSKHCMSYPDMLVYKVGALKAKEVCEEANELIKQLKLPLIARTNYTNGIFADSICIEPLNKD